MDFLAELTFNEAVCSSSVIVFHSPHSIGKSTILLQICEYLGRDKYVLYVSGEESANQIKLRANRLGVFTDNLAILSQTDVGTIVETIRTEKPDIVIIDSIQTMTYEECSSSAGSVTQVRECTNIFMQTAHNIDISIHTVKIVSCPFFKHSKKH